MAITILPFSHDTETWKWLAAHVNEVANLLTEKIPALDVQN